ncbi:UNVERIFIED_CONTAM: hypothetical protein PYX00_006444 [Menopon gallinae]|uniref:Sulfakinin n=1 Tax=Menopon gallinae TaxID=328185 RepID=A0AAW2HWP9_9NEOP
MVLHAMTAVFLLSYLCIPEEAMGTASSSKSRHLERRHHLGRLPVANDILIQARADVIGKRRQEQFDDYGHMRFGKRGESSEDYGHMRFGKRD